MFRIIGTLTSFFLLCSLTLAADWPQYRGVLGDGASDEAIDTPAWSTEGPKLLWKVDTPLGFSSFTVSGDRAFTMIGVDGHETCLALDAKTGKRLWTYQLGETEYNHNGGNSGAPGNEGGDGPRTTPAADGDQVFVYDGHLRLVCLNAADGRVQWQHDVANELGGRNIKWFNAVSPVIDAHRVYVPGGGAGQSFLAFDRQSGELVWKSGDDTMTHATPRLAKLHNKPQVIFFMKSGLVGIDAANGNTIWNAEFPFSVSTAASPIVDGNLVYCSAGYGVGAALFRVKQSGEAEEIWYKANELMNHWSTPVLKDGHLYGIFGFKKYGRAPLQCVELKTGEIKWSQPGFGPGNVILVGDHLVVLADDGRLVIADATPSGFTSQAEAKVLEGKCWSTPAFANGKIYVRSTEEGAAISL